VSGRTAYLDASAIVRLVRNDPGAAEMTALLRGMSNRITSVVSRAEVARSVAAGDPESLGRATEVMARLSMVALDPGIVTTAASLRPTTLGTVGAIHVASALLLADSLDAFLTYEPAIAAAAQGASLPVESPGVELAVADAPDTQGDAPTTDAAVVQRVVDRLVGRLRPARIIEPEGAPRSGGVLQLAMVPGPWSPGRGATWVGQEAIEDLEVRLELILVDEDTPEPPGRLLYDLEP
jgi:hypothetical protein